MKLRPYQAIILVLVALILALLTFNPYVRGLDKGLYALWLFMGILVGLGAGWSRD